MPICSRPFTLAAALAAGVLAACTTPPPQGVERSTPVRALNAEGAASAPAVAPPPPAPYRLAVGDEVELSVPGRPELTRTVRIAPDGRVAMPPLRSVPALGLSIDELEAALARQSAALAGGAPDAAERPRFVLSPGDEVEVRFIDNADMNQVVRVLPDGRVSLILVKTVSAAGRTPEELEAELTRRYGVYLKHAALSVSVRSYDPVRARVRVGDAIVPAAWIGVQPVVALKSFATPQVFVAGEVARPGVLPLRPGMTILQALIEAGGYKPSGELRSVIVLRKGGNGEALMIRRDLQADITGPQTNDIELQASDIVVLPKTAIASLVEVVDQYVYQLIAPLKNSSFSFYYNLRSNPSVTVN